MGGKQVWGMSGVCFLFLFYRFQANVGETLSEPLDLWVPRDKWSVSNQIPFIFLNYFRFENYKIILIELSKCFNLSNWITDKFLFKSLNC